MKQPADFEQMGYDSFLERWVALGYRPTPRDAMYECPLECREGTESRQAWIKGWLKARDEAS